MKPKKQFEIPQEDLFRMRLENMLDTNHELIKLSKHIDWERLDKERGALFVSTKGAPAIRTRLIAGLHYLKHLHDLSDEQVVKSWAENPYWQYFCGHYCPVNFQTNNIRCEFGGAGSSESPLSNAIKSRFSNRFSGKILRICCNLLCRPDSNLRKLKSR